MTEEVLLTPRQVSEQWGIAEQTLSVWRCRMEGPPYVRIGSRIRYRASDLRDFVERQTVRHEPQPEQ